MLSSKSESQIITTAITLPRTEVSLCSSINDQLCFPQLAVE